MSISLEYLFVVSCTICLLLSDYYLTLLGYYLYQKYSSSIVEFEQYELNPMWQQSVLNLKKLNPLHLSFILGAIFLISLVWILDIQPFQFFLGIIWIPFLIVNLLHLGNVASFYHLKKRPQDIKGKQKITYVYALKSSLLRLTQFELLLIFLALFESSEFILGGILGLNFLLIRFLLLYRRVIKQNSENPENKTNNDSGEYQR